MSICDIKKLPTYIAIGFLLLSVFFLGRHLSASPITSDLDYEIEYNLWRLIESPIKPKAKKLTSREAMDYHALLACICMKKLEEELYWYLPNYNDLQLAKTCYCTALAGIAAGDPKAKAAAMFLCLIGQYGLDVMDRYQTVSSLGHQAQHHYDLYIFFANLVAQGK